MEGLLVGLLFLLVGVVGVLYGARDWLPELASRHGAGIDSMLAYLLVTTGGLFFVGHALLAWLIWRGCQQSRVTHRLSSQRTERRLSVALGLLMALIAEGGVLAIGLPVWAEYYTTTPPENAVLIEVTGQQFQWNVRYPGPDREFGRLDPHLIDALDNPVGLDLSDPTAADDLLLISEITVPVDRPVRLRLRSIDVIHSFFLPHFRVKQDAVPGMVPEVVFVPTAEGSYELACTELCGLGHYRMQGFFNVVSAEAFERWLREQSSTS